MKTMININIDIYFNIKQNKLYLECKGYITDYLTHIMGSGSHLI